MRRAAIVLAALCALPAAANAAPPGMSVEQRLGRAEDELAVRRVLVDYAWALDTRDIDAYVGLFARDGEWVNGAIVRKGPDQIRALLVGMFGHPRPGQANRQSMEITTNPEVQVEGDHASARSGHVLLKPGPDGRPQAVLVGRYEDELIREGGKWKILRRVDHPLLPTAEEWAAIMRARAQAH